MANLKDILRDVHRYDLRAGQGHRRQRQRHDNAEPGHARRLLNGWTTCRDGRAIPTRAPRTSMFVEQRREITRDQSLAVYQRGAGQTDRQGAAHVIEKKLSPASEASRHRSRNVERSRSVADGEGTMGRLINDPAIANNVEQIHRGPTAIRTQASAVPDHRRHANEYNYLAGTYDYSVTLAPRPDSLPHRGGRDPRGLRHSAGDPQQHQARDVRGNRG